MFGLQRFEGSIRAENGDAGAVLAGRSVRALLALRPLEAHATDHVGHVDGRLVDDGSDREQVPIVVGDQISYRNRGGWREHARRHVAVA